MSRSFGITETRGVDSEDSSNELLGQGNNKSRHDENSTEDDNDNN